MKASFCAIALLLCCEATQAFAGTMSTQAVVTYDIDADNINSYASFTYSPSWYEQFPDPITYRFDTLKVLVPVDNWRDTTVSNSWSSYHSVVAVAYECYTTLLTIQQYDSQTDKYLGSYNDESAELCAPRRCFVTVAEFWPDGSIHIDDAGYYPAGNYYSYTAYDYSDIIFISWSGDVTSSARTVKGYLPAQDTFSLAALYDYKPCDPSTDPTCPCDPATNPSCQNQPPAIPNDVNSPIVINLAQGDFQLTGRDSPVVFDIAATGTPVRIGWTAAGADEAFLCFDRNGNGRIDDGSELFGTTTRLKNGLRAANGFAALAEYDDNHDGVIDEHDMIWSHLLLWRDFNHDGVSQPSELTPLSGSIVKAIRLNYHWTGRRDRWGNIFRYEATALFGNNAITVTPHTIYDIFFVSVP